MYKIGIVGHSIEHITDQEQTKEQVDQVVGLLKYQYGDDLVVNIFADSGVNHWAAESCIRHKAKYHLFLSCPIESLSGIIFPEQIDEIKKHLDSAWATSILSSNYNPKGDRHRFFVDNSSFVVCFWNGRCEGTTAECIKYAMETNKLVLRGNQNLQLLTKNDLSKK